MSSLQKKQEEQERRAGGLAARGDAAAAEISRKKREIFDAAAEVKKYERYRDRALAEGGDPAPYEERLQEARERQRTLETELKKRELNLSTGVLGQNQHDLDVAEALQTLNESASEEEIEELKRKYDA